MSKYGWMILCWVGWCGGVLAQPAPGQAGTMTPLAVQPRKPLGVPSGAVAPARGSLAAPRVLPAQPRPVSGTMRPLAVQPKRVLTVPGDAPRVRPAVPAAIPAAAPKVIYAAPPPVLAPTPPPWPPASVAVQPVALPSGAGMPAPVVPVAVPVPAAPVYLPVVHDELPMVEPEPPRVTLARGPAVVIEEEWEEEGAGDESTWPGLALGPKIGTTGLGLELALGLNRYMNLRSGFNYLALSSFGIELSGVDYDMDLGLPSIPLMLDLYPGGGNFRLSAGVYFQPGAKADLTSTPSSAVQIGAHTYGPDVVGTLSGEAEMGVVAPYLGIGFGNTVGEGKALSLSLDLGVMLQSYDVSLESNGAGMTALQNTFREDMVKEKDSVQDNMDDFRILPVLSLTLAYHF